MRRNAIAWVVIAASIAACTPEPQPPEQEPPSTESDRRAIEALREKELAAMNAGDVQGFIDIVTDDVVFDSPDRPAAIGKDAIRSLCEVIFERFDYDATYPADELVVDRNWAFDRGLWIEKVTPKQGGEQTEVSYGMLQVYRRQADGSWKLARSIWNRKKSSALQGPTPPLASRLSAWLAASHAPFRTPLRAGWRRRGVPSETTSDCG